MNWHTSNAELSRLYSRSPWLYLIEWRERLDRCAERLNGAAHAGKLDPGEAMHEAEALRDTITYLTATADRLEAGARKSEKLAALRNVEGRTPEEAAAYLRKADEIEAR